MGIWALLERNILNAVEMKYCSRVVEKNKLHTVHRTHFYASVTVLETVTEGNERATIVTLCVRYPNLFGSTLH